jgi:hypothetical protein
MITLRKSFFDQLKVASATKVMPVPQSFLELPNDAANAKARKGRCAWT